VENKTQQKAITTHNKQDLERGKYLHGPHDPSASRQSEAQAKEEHNTQMSQHMVKMKALHSTGASIAKGEAQQDIMDKHTREAFKRFDADGSGGIDADELRKALTSSGFGSDVLKVAMASFDKNGSGSIDYNEFCSMLAVLNKYDCDSEDTEGKGKIDITEKTKAVHEEKLKLLNSLQDAKAAVSAEMAAHKLLHNSHTGSMYEKRQLAAEEAQLQLERQRREDGALELKVAEQHLQRRGSMARRRESLDKQNSKHSRHNLLRKCSLLLPSL
jgi:Ca2+-binding EF-hand superfamily protein